MPTKAAVPYNVLQVTSKVTLVRKTLRCLVTNKSLGLDDIPSTVLKTLASLGAHFPQF